MSPYKQRIHRSGLPKVARCPFESCVYNRLGICFGVATNKGNGDSDCHKWSNKALLENLEEYSE